MSIIVLVGKLFGDKRSLVGQIFHERRLVVFVPASSLTASQNQSQLLSQSISQPFDAHCCHVGRVGIARAQGVGGGVEPPSSCLQTLIFE